MCLGAAGTAEVGSGINAGPGKTQVEGMEVVFAGDAASLPGPIEATGLGCETQQVQPAGPVLGKAKLCKFFLRGHCFRGTSCTFAHCRKELKPSPSAFRTEMCLEFANSGICHQGEACRHAHSEEEMRRSQLAQQQAQQQAQQAQAQQAQAQQPERPSTGEKKKKKRTSAKAAPTSLPVDIKPQVKALRAPRWADVESDDEDDVTTQDSFSQVGSGFSRTSSNSSEQGESDVLDDLDDVDMELTVKNSFLSFVPVPRAPATSSGRPSTRRSRQRAQSASSALSHRMTLA